MRKDDNGREEDVGVEVEVWGGWVERERDSQRGNFVISIILQFLVNY